MKTVLKNCLLCNNSLSGHTLHLGELPPCNRFQLQNNAVTDVHSLSLTECQSCGLIQLLNVSPISFTAPRFSWVRYNEPDAHLDSVAHNITAHLPKKNAHVCSVGPFDAPLLSRLESNVTSCHPLNLLAQDTVEQSTGIFPYLETIQAQLNSDLLKKIALKNEHADLVICRYLLEHCHDPVSALTGMRSLVNENGLLMIEVPDSTKFLTSLDYSFIWEEHVTYFTEDTLVKLLQRSGYQVIDLKRYPGQLEDALVALVRPVNELLTLQQSKCSSLFKSYASSFLSIKKMYQQELASITAEGRKVVIFGAGHQAVMFINAFDLGSYVSCILDDDVQKQGHFSPKFGIPIMTSDILLSDHDITMCLLAVSPRLEGKIQEKFTAFLQRGGNMYSIFPGSQMDNLMEISSCV